MIADRDVFVVGEQRLVGPEELACAGGVMDGGVEVGVVGDVDWLLEGRSCDGVEGGFGFFFLLGLCVGVQEGCEGFAEEGPSFGTLGHEQVESWGLTGFGERCGKETGGRAGVEVEEVGAYGDAEILLAFRGEGSVGEMREGKVSVGVIGVWEPALVSRDALFCHGA